MGYPILQKLKIRGLYRKSHLVLVVFFSIIDKQMKTYIKVKYLYYRTQKKRGKRIVYYYYYRPSINIWLTLIVA